MPARSARPWRLILPVASAVATLGACSSTSPPPAPSTTAPTAPAPATTSTTRLTTTPPTTVYRPSAPAATPDGAGTALVQAWSEGARTSAAAVAAPPAVATLFAQPFPAGYIQSRGCTDPSVDPGTCTYANRQTGSLFELTVTRAAGGWYISSVTVES